MLSKNHIRWNTIASLVALAVVLVGGLRMKAYLQSESAEESHAVTTTEQAHSEAAAGEHGAAEEHGEEHSLLSEIFHWFNFLVIVGAVWYAGKKFIGPALDRRGEAIREEMARSERAIQEAGERLAGVEAKLQKMDEEIQGLRDSALRDAAAEKARIEEMGKADAAKVAAVAGQEIASATKAARQELRAYTAELAVGLAQKKVQESMSAQSEDTLFRSFVQNLEGSARQGGAAPPGKGSANGPGKGA